MLFCSSWVGVFLTHRTFSAIMWLRNADFDLTKYNSVIFISEWLHYFFFPPNSPFPFYFGVEYKNNFCETLVDFLSKCVRLTFSCNSVHVTRSEHII